MMKKILSVLCAVSMLMSMVSLSVSASTKPTVSGTVRATITDGKIAKGDYIYIDYRISNLEGLDKYHVVEDDDFNEFPVVTGVSMFQTFFTWDTSKLAYNTTNSTNVFGADPTVDTSAGTYNIAFNTVTKTAFITDIEEPVITLAFRAKSDLTEDVSVLFSKSDETIVRVASYDEVNTKGTTADYRTGDSTLSVVDTVIKIAADEPEEITAKNEVVGTYNGKTLKLIAEVLDTVDAQKKVAILNKTTNERRESGRTLAQIVNGVAVENNSITGKLAVGVLLDAANASDEFAFELYE